jgi:hypothetical protein
MADPQPTPVPVLRTANRLTVLALLVGVAAPVVTLSIVVGAERVAWGVLMTWSILGVPLALVTGSIAAVLYLLAAAGKAREIGDSRGAH